MPELMEGTRYATLKGCSSYSYRFPVTGPRRFLRDRPAPIDSPRDFDILMRTGKFVETDSRGNVIDDEHWDNPNKPAGPLTLVRLTPSNLPDAVKTAVVPDKEIVPPTREAPKAAAQPRTTTAPKTETKPTAKSEGVNEELPPKDKLKPSDLEPRGGETLPGMKKAAGDAIESKK